AFTHQDLPFEKLVDELHPERDTAISPLFQAMFILQNPDSFSPQLEGLTVHRMSTSTHTAKFDLSLAITERDGSARATLNYNADLFESTTIEQMLRHFHTLLEGITRDPDLRIADLPLLSGDDSHALLAMCNGRATNYPDDRCIHQLFEDQAAKTPDAVAVVFEGQQLTYRELNHKANHLAHQFLRLGFAPESRIALSLERGIVMAAAVLAVLKTGSSYVALDPEYPTTRLAFMLEDSEAAILLTQTSLADRFIGIAKPDRNSSLTVMC